MEEQTPARKWLSLAAEREALTRMEDAARTEEDFKAVIKQWDHLDENRERMERYNETLQINPLLEWGAATFGNAIIPIPFGHGFWRQLLSGSFLDVIYDCPHELHEQTANITFSTFLNELKDKQKEVLYYIAIRGYSAQQLAKYRGQTDRNINKVYKNLLKELRAKMYDWLSSQYDENLPLSINQREFVEDYRAGVFDKKATLDEKSGE